MERALVTRLYRDESSQEAVMLMEATESKERIKVTIPCQRAGIIALEAHGLNDRCPLYGMFAQCVGEMGAVFRSVVITKDESRHASAAISLSKGEHTSWIGADVAELVAFAMHARIPIYVRKSETPQTKRTGSPPAKADLPSIFDDALADIHSSESDG